MGRVRGREGRWEHWRADSLRNTCRMQAALVHIVSLYEGFVGPMYPHLDTMGTGAQGCQECQGGRGGGARPGRAGLGREWAGPGRVGQGGAGQSRAIACDHGRLACTACAWSPVPRQRMWGCV